MQRIRGNAKVLVEAMGICRGNANDLLRQRENAEVMQRFWLRQ
jgi:hypothetical protein